MTSARDAEFSAFVSARATRLLRFSTLLVGDAAGGEDLLQTVLEKTYRRWSKSGTARNPDGYVREALLNAARRQWRVRGSRQETLVGLVPDQTIMGGQGTVLVRQALLQALSVLTKQQRAVIVLRYFADQSEAEVARLLGCSAGTVKAHASRGLERMRSDKALAGTFGSGDLQ